MHRIVKNNVQWVGKVDWELRRFHGDEYSTHRGSSYNSYLVREKKTALVDTVWGPYAEESGRVAFRTPRWYTFHCTGGMKRRKAGESMEHDQDGGCSRIVLA